MSPTPTSDEKWSRQVQALTGLIWSIGFLVHELTRALALLQQ